MKMTNRFLAFFGMALATGVCVQSFAADDQKAADKPATTRPERGGNRGGGQGGPGGYGAGAFGRDALRETISALGELSLTPEFTLTSEQKQKIQAIRDDYKKQQEKWRTDHEADLKKMQDSFADLRGGDLQANRDKMRDLGKQREDIMATAPKTEEFAKQIKAVLTDDQIKQLEASEKDRQAEQEKNRRNFGAGLGGGFGGGFGGGQGGRGGNKGGDKGGDAK